MNSKLSKNTSKNTSCTTFENLKNLEKNKNLPFFPPGWSYGEINEGVRTIIVDWAYQTSSYKKLSKQVVDLAIVLMDSYIIRNKVEKTKIQLVYLSCLFISSKKFEVCPIELSELVLSSHKEFTDHQIVEMESKIFGYLNGCVEFPLVCEYLRYISYEGNSDGEVHKLSGVLARMMYLSLGYSRFLPSVIATSAHMIISNMKGVEPVNPFGHSEEELEMCCFNIKDILLKVKNSTLDFFKSFSSELGKNNSWNYLVNYVGNQNFQKRITATKSVSFQVQQTNSKKQNMIIYGKLGEGAYGSVYRAKGKKDNVPCAYKEFKHEDDDGLSQSLVREVSILRFFKDFDNPNVLSIFDIVLNDKDAICGYTSELMDGDLHDYYRKTYINQKEYLDIILQLVKGLCFIHSWGIIHRDIKPQNILVKKDENGNLNIKIADLGLVRGGCVVLQSVLQTKEAFTLWYRPPELLLGGSYDNRGDWWSLGCVIWEMMNGRALFRGTCEIDQLFKIFEICGSPSVKMWPNIAEYPHWSVNKFPNFKGRGLWSNKKIDPTINEIMNMCLTMSVSNNFCTDERPKPCIFERFIK